MSSFVKRFRSCFLYMAFKTASGFVKSTFVLSRCSRTILARKGTRGDQAKLSLYPVAFPDQIVEVQAGPANFPVGLALLAHQHLQEENLLLIVKLLQIRANTLVFFQAPRPLGTG
jgi:hypothetical protein